MARETELYLPSVLLSGTFQALRQACIRVNVRSCDPCGHVEYDWMMGQLWDAEYGLGGETDSGSEDEGEQENEDESGIDEVDEIWQGDDW